MATSLGRFLKELRSSRGEMLKDMAEQLGVSSAFLSAVKKGKKKMPESWYGKLHDIYHLNEDQDMTLRYAVMESSDVVELNIKNASPGNRRLAVTFAHRFDSLDEKTGEKILNILNARKENTSTR